MGLGTFVRQWFNNWLSFVAILGWRDACAAFEIAAKRGLAWKSESVRNALHRGIYLIGKNLFGTMYYELLYPVTGGMACLFFDHLAEMLGGEAEQVGIEIHVAMLHAVFYYCVLETKAQSFVCGVAWTDRDIVEVVYDLRKGVDTAYQYVLTALNIDRCYMPYGIDNGHYGLVLAVGKMEMWQLLIDIAHVPHVQFAKFRVNIGRNNNHRGLVVGTDVVRN